jgi:hypothetical protein
MSSLPRSLKYEYELYVEREVEAYKELLPRSELLQIGDEAAAVLAAQQQLALTELLLCDEVDRIIRARLRLPKFATWRRRRLKTLHEIRRPERWGLRPDGPVAQEIPVDGHVLVAGAEETGPTLFLAANGCAVTALNADEDTVDRVMLAASEVGLASRVRGYVTDFRGWAPDAPLHGVICTASAFAGLSRPERTETIALLQRATPAGGVHLLEARRGGEQMFTYEEFQTNYGGWQTSVERSGMSSETFFAKKLSV